MEGASRAAGTVGTVGDTCLAHVPRLAEGSVDRKPSGGSVGPTCCGQTKPSGVLPPERVRGARLEEGPPELLLSR